MHTVLDFGLTKASVGGGGLDALGLEVTLHVYLRQLS